MGARNSAGLRDLRVFVDHAAESVTSDDLDIAHSGAELHFSHLRRRLFERHTTEGLSKKDIVRCLKRYIAREVYHPIQADLTGLHQRLTPQTAT